MSFFFFFFLAHGDHLIFVLQTAVIILLVFLLILLPLPPVGLLRLVAVVVQLDEQVVDDSRYDSPHHGPCHRDPPPVVCSAADTQV